MSSILESIKSEKRMPLTHWRFRILHWCFGVKVDNYKTSPLPNFLYTHYCPLFHLTNLIALFIVPILFIKVITGIVKGIGTVCCLVPWGKIGEFFSNLLPERKEVQPTKESLIRADRKKIVQLLCADHYDKDQFYMFWAENRYKLLSGIEETEVEEIFNNIVTKISDAKEKVRLRKEKMRQRMVFWVNFSQIFLKWFFNILYVALAIAVGYACFSFAGPVFFAVVDFFKWIVTFNPVPFLLFMAKFLVILAGLAVVGYGFWRFSLMRRMGSAVVEGAVAASPPFILVFNLFTAPFRWIYKGCRNTCEFFAVFYEENCPPITIISEEEGAIEESVDME